MKLREDKSKARSVDSLINLIHPLINLKIISDDGTDLSEMLHPPKQDELGNVLEPGKVSILSLGTSPINDRRRNALVTSLCQQLIEYSREDNSIEPVFVMDETKQFAPSRKTSDTEATVGVLSTVHLQTRAWGVTRVWGFQNASDVADWLLGGNTPIHIQMHTSLPLSDGRTKLYGAGHAHVFVEGTGDENIPDHNFICRALPCRTKHVD